MLTRAHTNKGKQVKRARKYYKRQTQGSTRKGKFEQRTVRVLKNSTYHRAKIIIPNNNGKRNSFLKLEKGYNDSYF